MSGLILNGDTSGSVTLNIPAVAGTNTVTLPAQTGNIPVLPTGYTLGAGNTSSFKNRIINGGMVIDQRNNGAVYTGVGYSIDRWANNQSITGKFTVQQNAGSVTPPVGFINYLGAASTSAYTAGSTEEYIVYQPIEGLNMADLGWGTANAKTVTLSFWVYSSLTGTFGGSFRNSAVNRSCPFSYTISSANTWEQKSVTITGDTSGTWLTTNGVGTYISFSLGAGSTRVGTAGTWVAANYVSVTGATSVVGTNGATFYITGVQFEVGSQATSFDFRDYGRELAMCQRYFQKRRFKGQPGPANQTISAGALGLLVHPRTVPSVAFYDSVGNVSRISTQASGDNQTMSSAPGSSGTDPATIEFDFQTGSSIGFWWTCTLWISAEL